MAKNHLQCLQSVTTSTLTLLAEPERLTNALLSTLTSSSSSSLLTSSHELTPTPQHPSPSISILPCHSPMLKYVLPALSSTQQRVKTLLHPLFHFLHLNGSSPHLQFPAQVIASENSEMLLGSSRCACKFPMILMVFSFRMF